MRFAEVIAFLTRNTESHNRVCIGCEPLALKLVTKSGKLDEQHRLVVRLIYYVLPKALGYTNSNYSSICDENCSTFGVKIDMVNLYCERRFSTDVPVAGVFCPRVRALK